jgi:hypothetical protein
VSRRISQRSIFSPFPLLCPAHTARGLEHEKFIPLPKSHIVAVSCFRRKIFLAAVSPVLITYIFYALRPPKQVYAPGETCQRPIDFNEVFSVTVANDGTARDSTQGARHSTQGSSNRRALG